MENKSTLIRIMNRTLTDPITDEIADEAIQLLNRVFNSTDFKEELSSESFYSSNRPDFSGNSTELPGKLVYEDFMNKGLIEIDVMVKHLVNPVRRFVSKTYGATNINGNQIVTYTWWLSDDPKERIIEYATHIGHEIFHTSHFKYIHDPEYGHDDFEIDKDVSYKIDEIVEKLIRKTLPA